jgi:SAM-dependent MidA family methyltransferase
VPRSEPNALEAQLRAEIEQSGPISFERFMEAALYTPGLGYYTRERDPFGAAGDFYTAEQLQPVFGILITQWIGATREAMGAPQDFQVVELGAGRGEMAEALSPFRYTAVDVRNGIFPAYVRGVVFANEFFDALPAPVAVRRDGAFRELLVTHSDGAFRFVEGEPCEGAPLEYALAHHANAEESDVIEIPLRALEWVDRIAASLDGHLLVIDYGYTARERARHAAGTLMSYRRHQASPDVLSDPGGRDITAHVPFTAIEERARLRGLSVRPLETLASFLLRIGEADQFAAALAGEDERAATRRRMQLKTLLFSMGETFRVLDASSATQ